MTCLFICHFNLGVAAIYLKINHNEQKSLEKSTAQKNEDRECELFRFIINISPFVKRLDDINFRNHTCLPNLTVDSSSSLNYSIAQLLYEDVDLFTSQDK